MVAWAAFRSVSVVNLGTTDPSAPARINLGKGSVNSSLAFTFYFDIFLINLGFTTYLSRWSRGQSRLLKPALF
jgi:hypothetical protein